MNNVSSPTNILGRMATVLVPAMDGEFRAIDHFTENVKKDATTRISNLGGGFRRSFLGGSGKIEGPAKEMVLGYTEILTPAIDKDIIAEVGDEMSVQVTLRQFLWLLQQQHDGREDTLRVKEKTERDKKVGAKGNVFYILDQNGILKSVAAAWHNDGWAIGSLDISCDRTKWNEWEFGNLVFFPRPHPLGVHSRD